MTKSIFNSTAIRKEVDRIGKLIVRSMKANLKRNNTNSTGKLSQSIDYRYVERTGDSLSLRFSMKDYGKVVEKGRSKGRMPPQKPIKGWIESKGLNTGNKSLSSAAFAISKKIARTGTPAQPFIKPALERGKQEMRLSDKIQATLKATFNKSFKAL